MKRVLDGGGSLYRTTRSRSRWHARILCRELWRNPAIPTHICWCLTLSLSNTVTDGCTRRTRINTAVQYHWDFFGVPSSSTDEGFDTVEVRSSSLLVPTISLLLSKSFRLSIALFRDDTALSPIASLGASLKRWHLGHNDQEIGGDPNQTQAESGNCN
jgi:hypothetical protein